MKLKKLLVIIMILALALSPTVLNNRAEAAEIDANGVASTDEETQPQAKSFSITYDPNGGTIDEAVSKAEVKEGEVYSTLYDFQLKLKHDNLNFDGWDVLGEDGQTATVLNSKDEPVSILTQYPEKIKLTQNVILKARWKKTDGLFRIYENIETQAASEKAENKPEKIKSIKLKGEGRELEMVSNSSSGNAELTKFQYDWIVNGKDAGNYGVKLPSGDYEVTLYSDLFDGTHNYENKFEENPYLMRSKDVLSGGKEEAGSYTFKVHLDFDNTGQPCYRLYTNFKETGKREPQKQEFKLTYDPNGAAIDNDKTQASVKSDEYYTTLYDFQLKMKHEKLLFDGWDVLKEDGKTPATVLNKKDEAVSTLSRYQNEIKLTENVVLKARWKKAEGLFRIFENFHPDSKGGEILRIKKIEIKGEGIDFPMTTHSYSGYLDGRRIYDWVVNGEVVRGYGQIIDSGDYEVTIYSDLFNGSYDYKVNFKENPYLLNNKDFISDEVEGDGFYKFKIHLDFLNDKQPSFGLYTNFEMLGERAVDPKEPVVEPENPGDSKEQTDSKNSKVQENKGAAKNEKRAPQTGDTGYGGYVFLAAIGVLGIAGRKKFMKHY